MNGVPYWFIFWAGFVVLGTGGMLIGLLSSHRTKMKALEILRLYAERGTEPPPMLAEHLITPAPGTPHQGGAWKHPAETGHYLGSFAFSFFMGGAAAGVAWWWNQADKTPEWVFYAAVIAAVAFAMGGIAHFICAFVAAISGFANANANAACLPRGDKPNPPPPPAP